MKGNKYGLLILALVCFLCIATAGPLEKKAQGRGNMYEEFDGIMIFYTPKDLVTYRALLPEVFDMPDEPLVEVFFIDYYKMAEWTLKPYQEAAVFLLAKYKGEEAWHCITMPVTTESARIGGIKYLGYPKVLANVTLKRNDPIYSGSLSINGKEIMQVTLDTKGGTVSTREEGWFSRLTGIPSLNILNGRIIDPIPAVRRSKVSMLELSARYPAMFTVKVGQAKITS
ncbi:MAG: acetoacetate decarboxylase family protein, partial [Deltaproteobacteria bacterium]|nr:acetoacetate decarboxylase family protein [Deltaproteobacteria bacterium]